MRIRFTDINKEQHYVTYSENLDTLKQYLQFEESRGFLFTEGDKYIMIDKVVSFEVLENEKV